METQQLSGIDASFLYLETPETPMHVAGLTYFELPPGCLLYTSPSPRDS